MNIRVWFQGREVAFSELDRMDQDGCYGPHIMLDLSDCNPERLKDFSLVYDQLKGLPEAIGMNIILGPMVLKYDGGGEPTEYGHSGVTVIAESHVSIHTYPAKRYAFADIFSCKPFSSTAAIMTLIEAFQAQNATIHYVRRGEHFPRTSTAGF